MSKKIYAIQCDPETFDYRDYFDEWQAADLGIWVGGNRGFGEINADLRSDIVKALEDAQYDIDVAWSDYSDAGKTDEVAYRNEVVGIVRHYFKKESGEPLTPAETDKLADLATNFNGGKATDANAAVCDVLGIIHGKPYAESIIRGCSQGDWLEIIYPKEFEGSIRYVESVLFATGTEFKITDEAYDEEPDLDEVDVYFDYTDKWRLEDIKAWIANMAEVKPEDVVVKTIKGRHTVYDYETA